MKIYIASKYIIHQKINREIFKALKEVNIDVFLPESININAITCEDMLAVAEKCFDEIDKCDVILVVAPFGKSVSSEIGYAIAKKRLGELKKIILFKFDEDDNVMETEAMIAPYIEVIVKNTYELINYLTNEIRGC